MKTEKFYYRSTANDTAGADVAFVQKGWTWWEVVSITWSCTNSSGLVAFTGIEVRDNSGKLLSVGGTPPVQSNGTDANYTAGVNLPNSGLIDTAASALNGFPTLADVSSATIPMAAVTFDVDGVVAIKANGMDIIQATIVIHGRRVGDDS